MPERVEFACNGRVYRPGDAVYAVVCIDGGADEYLDEALMRGRMPNMAEIIRGGRRGMCRAQMPTFTNTNNASIITGAPPRVHGMNGNFFLDPETGEAVMMNDGRFLRAPTIVAAAAKAGRKCAVVTAKDKLRTILTKGLDGIGFSAERAGEATEVTHGIGGVEALVGEATPAIYSGDASVYVLKAGAAMVERGLADLLYLSLTDYIQHAHAPNEAAALDFYARLDEQLGRLIAAGVVLGITADHGMNAKHDETGRARVVYLEPWLAERFEGGAACRVVLPITDPYVAHHGSLGSYAVVHVAEGMDAREVAEALYEIEGVTEAHPMPRAAALLELAPDRVGDVVVMSGRDTVLGRAPEHHDLSQLGGPLRSHGGRYEEMVPMIFSRPLDEAYGARFAGDVRNFDVFEYTLNGTVV